MRKQKEIWEREHETSAMLPSHDSEKESGNVVLFAKYLKEKGLIPPLNCIDIGCGKGRNSIYLAKLGFHVYAMDYIEKALEIVRERARKNNLLNVKTILGNIDEDWPFESNFFDVAIDNYSSIDIETKAGREKYKSELMRTLKPKGYALVCVVSANDELERKQMEGPEKNSVFWSENNKFQKNYDEEELKEFYKEFKILELREVSKKSEKLGKAYIATNYWVVLQK